MLMILVYVYNKNWQFSQVSEKKTLVRYYARLDHFFSSCSEALEVLFFPDASGTPLFLVKPFLKISYIL